MSARASATALRAFIQDAFIAAGLPAADAGSCAALMAEADLNGSDTHGVFRLASYIERIEAGGINRTPAIRILQDRAAAALVDGDNGMGHLVMRFAVATAIAKARSAGAAWVGARMSNHAGPANLYARMALPHDMLAIYFAMGNANHMPPWGGAEGLLCTNPVAIAVPAGEEPPVVLDMATSIVAFGKVKALAERGEAMPEGWMVDAEGAPLTDPAKLDGALLLPFGGYKGYALSLMFSLLAATLNGAPVGRDIVDFHKDGVTPTNTGQSILVVDIAAFGPVADFKSRVDAFVRDIRGAKRAPGVERIWLPGEQSHAKRRDREQHGVPMSSDLLRRLDRLGARLGIAPLDRIQHSTTETT